MIHFLEVPWIPCVPLLSSNIFTAQRGARGSSYLDNRLSIFALGPFICICKFHMIKMSSIEQFKVCTITQHTNADSATSHQGLPLSTQSNFECDKIHVGCISGTAEKSERLFQVRWNLPKCIYLRENLLSTISK